MQARVPLKHVEVNRGNPIVPGPNDANNATTGIAFFDEGTAKAPPRKQRAVAALLSHETLEPLKGFGEGHPFRRHVLLRDPFTLYHVDAFAATGSGISTLPVAGSMGPGAPKILYLSVCDRVGVVYLGSGGGVIMMPGTRLGSFAPDSSWSC